MRSAEDMLKELEEERSPEYQVLAIARLNFETQLGIRDQLQRIADALEKPQVTIEARTFDSDSLADIIAKQAKKWPLAFDNLAPAEEDQHGRE